MENLLEKDLFEVHLNEEGRSNLTAIAQWAFINAIVGFIALGVSVLSTIMTASSVSRLGGSEYRSAYSGGAFLGTIITVAISLLLNITLLGAANALKKGIANSDQGYFAAGISKLSGYFKILGILMIILLVIFVFAMLILMMVGTSR